MSVFDRASLEQSPLSDLHTIASELSIDGYRRFRKPELVDAILARQSGEERSVDAGETSVDAREEAPDDAGEAPAPTDEEESAPRRRRGRRGGRGRGGRAAKPADEEREADGAEADAKEDREDAAEARGEGPGEIEEQLERAGGEERPARGERAAREDRTAREEPARDELVAGVVELLPGGSGFVRVEPPEPSDDDVYISAAQVKRCELVSGDRITGPRRPPRRSERFASLLRVDTVNGQSAAELGEGARFDELPAAFPSERFELGNADDPTIKAITELAPIGCGSRVAIVGPSQSGKTETLRRLADALGRQADLQVWLVLAGVRPEEIPQWGQGVIDPAATATFAASADAQWQAVEGVIDQARRITGRGAHTVVLIDTLDGAPPHLARRALAAARKIVDGGSLTVIATTAQPVGGETTVVALDPRLAAARKFPAIDVGRSWTMRPELLVGESATQKIARARAKALGA
jgi:transcription termination factor Rho